MENTSKWKCLGSKPVYHRETVNFSYKFKWLLKGRCNRQFKPQSLSFHPEITSVACLTSVLMDQSNLVCFLTLFLEKCSPSFYSASVKPRQAD
jgi:hypothetical protein